MKKIAMLLAFSLIAPLAHADLLLEPFLGYYAGKLDRGTGKNDASGLGYGARIGFQQLGLMVGGEFMTGAWSDDANPSNDIKPENIGVFVGYNFPVLLRVWATYNLQTKAKVKSSASASTVEGDSLKFGVGCTILPLVSINAEYMTGTFDESDGTALSPKWKSNMYGLSVSLPLTF